MNKTIPAGYIATPVSQVNPGDVLRPDGKVEDIFMNPNAESDSDVSFVFVGLSGNMLVKDFADVEEVEVLQYAEVPEDTATVDIRKFLTTRNRNHHRARR